MPAAKDLRREARRLGHGVNGHPEEVAAAVPRLAEILDACAGDTDVTRDAVDALGHAWHASAAEVLLTRVPVDHPSSEVRLSLARALPCGGQDAGPVRDRVIEALAALLDDEHARVRDWAAFGLGQVEADTPASVWSSPLRSTCCRRARSHP